MMALLLGNDVVDLLDADTALPRIEPFLNRVFCPSELSLLKHPGDTDAIWSVWACKEAAFKALRSHDSGFIFSWKRFEVQSGFETVRCNSHIFACRLDVNRDRISVVCSGEAQRDTICPVAFNDGICNYTEQIDEILERSFAGNRDVAARKIDPERFRSHQEMILDTGDLLALARINRESAGVRLLAIEKAAMLLGISENRFQVTYGREKKAPQILLDGTPLLTATFSHHGRFAAVAFAAPTKRG